MAEAETLQKQYPWIQSPLIVGAPMRLIALAEMAVEVSNAGGLGFIGAGADVGDLSTQLDKARKLLQNTSILTTNGTLPIGVGFVNWGADLKVSIDCIKKYRPAAIWIFAPSSTSSMVEWVQRMRQASPETKIWVQVGSVKEALDAVLNVNPDVLVVQGTDAGGHGRVQGASLMSLLPEVSDAIEALFQEPSQSKQNRSSSKPILIAAGGIVEARSASAAFTLGASGVVLGTRLLASPEANITKGYRDEVLRASDGGQTTVRTKVYDTLRSTIWPETHNARGIINKSYTDAIDGMSDDENRRLYNEEVKKGDTGWGVENRMTTYAGSAVGLVKEVKPAGEIVREVREGIIRGALGGMKAKL